MSFYWMVEITYQGNMWFGYYKGTAAVTFMNYTKYDVMVSFHKTIIKTINNMRKAKEGGNKSLASCAYYDTKLSGITLVHLNIILRS